MNIYTFYSLAGNKKFEINENYYTISNLENVYKMNINSAAFYYVKSLEEYISNQKLTFTQYIIKLLYVKLRENNEICFLSEINIIKKNEELNIITINKNLLDFETNDYYIVINKSSRLYFNIHDILYCFQLNQNKNIIENIKNLLDYYKYEFDEDYNITIANYQTNEVYITLNRSYFSIYRSSTTCDTSSRIFEENCYEVDYIEKNEFDNFTYLKDLPTDLENTILKITIESETLNDMNSAFKELELEKSEIIETLINFEYFHNSYDKIILCK
jgi:hypothetical protein